MEASPDSDYRNEKGQFVAHYPSQVKPWTYRKQLVPSATYCGRVVHHRKPHAFTQKDVERIVRNYGAQISDLPLLLQILAKIASFILGLIFGQAEAEEVVNRYFEFLDAVSRMAFGEGYAEALRLFQYRFWSAIRDPKALEWLLNRLKG